MFKLLLFDVSQRLGCTVLVLANLSWLVCQHKVKTDQGGSLIHWSCVFFLRQ